MVVSMIAWIAGLMFFCGGAADMVVYKRWGMLNFSVLLMLVGYLTYPEVQP